MNIEAYSYQEIIENLHDGLYFVDRKRIGILFMDIDHFKSFNDTYGHHVGDEVLKFVAGTFVANARPFDLFGRWGGEEFIGIIRNIRAEDLKRLGNRCVH